MIGVNAIRIIAALENFTLILSFSAILFSFLDIKMGTAKIETKNTKIIMFSKKLVCPPKGKPEKE